MLKLLARRTSLSVRRDSPAFAPQKNYSPPRTIITPPAFDPQLSIICIYLAKMTSSGTIDYSNVVLILGNFDGADEILDWSDNSRFKFTPPVAGCSWRGDQPSEQELKAPFLCLKIGENLFDPRGWILGSHGDSDACDLQLATTNQSGISRLACRIDIDPKTHKPRVTQLSNRPFHIYGPSLLRCQPGVPQVLPSPATMNFGAVHFRVWTPKRTATEASQYRTKARKYSEDIMGSIPKPLPSLPSHKKTSADSVRFGADGAVYVVDGHGTHGRGAHASVMKVKKIGTGEYFGAKEPYFKISDNPDIARDRFETLRTEYNHIKRLDHPHIVKAFDLVVAEDSTRPPWMIVEYIPLNLREALHTFDERDRIATITHLGSALTHLHANGITHRDLKPDNALVARQDGVLLVKLADFGTSKQNTSATMDTFTGTEIYMAPELFAKPRCYTSKVDMWALGLIALQLFSSWNPDTDNTWDPNNFAVWVCTVALPSISEASGFLQPLIKKLLRRDAGRRWSSRKCLRWLWKHESLNSPPVSEPSTDRTIRHKRRASKDLQRRSGEYYSRQRRSPNPSLSTARARLSELRDGCSLPDTASPVSGELDIPSVASTPQADGMMSDLENTSDEESSGGDTDLEDWQME
ncbi:Calcium/calmodulin-dependent protein kinase type IV [Akanthomyces lecanii RCEF 1005]|uniref:non-specific serine/threonine protein kinase n=1 Tax=Akanthomyces lecanii RCEF 1005 TaxID=1081108 RepID=A0A167XLA7_CORDF|nr:Calcium/calmodulin-dependent protein kinase type IV [Akanthomyces lecanii RCEF 1005]